MSMSQVVFFQAALGTNPLAMGAPAENGDRFLLDMATTAVAVGKVNINTKTISLNYQDQDFSGKIMAEIKRINFVFEGKKNIIYYIYSAVIFHQLGYCILDIQQHRPISSVG